MSGLPVERDTIFRIASLTKPVTTVAALMLLDEGRFDLDEPITQCAPELACMRVLRDPNGPLDQTDQAKRPITFRDLPDASLRSDVWRFSSRSDRSRLCGGSRRDDRQPDHARCQSRAWRRCR